MKPKTVKIITYFLFAVVILLILATIETKQRIYGIGAALVCIGAGVFESVCYKCPACGKFPGAFSNRCCPHCGEVIWEDKKKK